MRPSFHFDFKKILLVLFVCIGVTGLFLTYFFTIGVPKTQARNYYNAALKEEEKGNREKALEYLNTAKGFWRETYIDQEIKNLQND